MNQDSLSQSHWQTVMQMMRGYRTAHLLITCAQLDIFRHLASGPQTAESLAVATNTAAPALNRLLNAATAAGLLRKDGDQYRNSPLAETCLAAEGPYYLGNLLRREGAFYQRWSYLTDAVRTGRRPDANIRDEGQTNWVLDFELAMFDLSRAAGPPIAEALALPDDRPILVLDVGGGHGGYSMALTRRYSNVAATVFELPAAADVARAIIAREGMIDRVEVQNGDFLQDELGDQEYDLLLLFGVLVSETPENKLNVLSKAYRALAPGGRVVIRGFWLDGDRTGPPEATLFSLHMLLSTEAGDISSLAEMKGYLTEAGFQDPVEIILPDWVGSSLLAARKP